MALLTKLILGSCSRRFYDAQEDPFETPKDFPGHSIALQLMGTMILWFGCEYSSGVKTPNQKHIN